MPKHLHKITLWKTRNHYNDNKCVHLIWKNIQYDEKEVFRIPQHHYCNKRVGIEKPLWSLAGLYSDLPLTIDLLWLSWPAICPMIFQTLNAQNGKAVFIRRLGHWKKSENKDYCTKYTAAYVYVQFCYIVIIEVYEAIIMQYHGWIPKWTKTNVCRNYFADLHVTIWILVIDEITSSLQNLTNLLHA